MTHHIKTKPYFTVRFLHKHHLVFGLKRASVYPRFNIILSPRVLYLGWVVVLVSFDSWRSIAMFVLTCERCDSSERFLERCSVCLPGSRIRIGSLGQLIISVSELYNVTIFSFCIFKLAYIYRFDVQ